MQIIMAVWGLGVGMNISLFLLSMPHFMGVELMAAIFSVNSLMLSISMIIFGPMFGERCGDNTVHGAIPFSYFLLLQKTLDE